MTVGNMFKDSNVAHDRVFEHVAKNNSPCKAVVFKRQYRSFKRSENDPALSALWRGAEERRVGDVIAQ